MLPLFTEPEDSGIDSDDTGRNASRNRLQEDAQQSESSSTDDEETIPWWRIPILKHCDEELAKVIPVLHCDEDDEDLDMMQWPPVPKPDDHQPVNKESPERASPPLYEVELTASDEDEDTSVLELVIPMQSSRYQRVPTSSPKKVKPKSRKFFCNILCCVRK